MPIPFETLSWLEILVVVVAYVFGFYVRGSFGFGSNLPIVLITAWFLGALDAVLLVSVVATYAQVQLLPQGVRDANWKRTIPMVVTMTIGGAVGVWLLRTMSADWLLLVLGLIVGVMMVTERMNLLVHLGRFIDVRASRVTATLGCVSSVAGTLAGGGTMYLLVPFLRIAANSPAEFRSTNMMVAGLSTMIRIVMLSFAGLVSLELLVDALVLWPVTVVAALAGGHFFRTSSPERFFSALQRMMMVAAVLLMIKGILVLTA